MHDIDPRQVVAELLNTVPVDGARVAGADRRGAPADLAARAAAAKDGAAGSPAR
jgi:hypothetical protein